MLNREYWSNLPRPEFDCSGFQFQSITESINNAGLIVSPSLSDISFPLTVTRNVDFLPAHRSDHVRSEKHKMSHDRV